jgi:hypothetical protein
MSIRRKTSGVLVAGSILVFVAALFIKFTVYDALRLAWFAHRIAESDRIVATNWLSAVSLTITGDETKKVVRAISSAGSGRPPFGTDWANIYDVNAKFCRGTKVLGEIEMDGGGLFLIYYHRPPFRESTGLLHELVYKPISDAARTAEMKKFESQ